MSKDVERREREERAKRLVWARKQAGFRGPRAVAERFGFNENNYKAHEAGRNGFSAAIGDMYADAFGVSRKWLYLNIGSPEDTDDGPVSVIVPHLSWVSAGAMLREDAADEALGHLTVNDLPAGDWIALTVSGDSMDRISPPGSTIFVDRRDKALVPNALYVIADDEGNATYKRFRPGPPRRFEPVSVSSEHEPIVPDHDPVIVGRVKRSTLDTM